MKKFLVLLMLGFTTVAVAQADLYFAEDDPALNKKEWQAAKLAGKWISKDVKPYLDRDGKIVYIYGIAMPTVICAPLKLCDLELQAGEEIRYVNVGDPRWDIQKISSGPDGAVTPHLIIKALDMGVTTTLIVATSRRTYHIKLLARSKNYMPRVGFRYPEEEQAKVFAKEVKKTEEVLKNTMPDTGENFLDLNFEYKISGDKSVLPLRAYNNGTKTIIQMPKNLTATEAPALLVLDEHGDKQMVNYRLHHDRYIVDQLFHKAVLISGVGRRQKIATIVKKG